MLVSATGLRNDRGEEVYVTDEMVNRLLLDFSTGKSQEKAEARVRNLTEPEKHKLRARCKRDLFFLCYGVLGNNRLSVNLHGDLCRHVEITEQNRFREYLMPRGHFKSTVITIGHSIQVALPYTPEDAFYDEEKDQPIYWPGTLGPDVRLLIAHETHESAARFLYAITNHFTNNSLLMGLFPELVPQIRKHRINKWELELPRTITGNPEPTFDTLGVGGKSQGRHYNYIKLDDIFGDKARDSEAEAETTRQWFDNIQSFFSTFNKDKLDLIGTRYSYDDVYGHAHEKYGNKLIKYIRKVEEFDPKLGKKVVIFPEEFDEDTLSIIKKNTKVYNAQYLNDPDESNAGFDQSWKRYFYWVSQNTIAVFSGHDRTLINVRDLDICILADPGVSKTGGLVVTGMDHMQRVFTLVALALEMQPPQFVELIFRQVIRWQPRIVAIESDVFANTYQFWLQTEMIRRGVRFNIYPAMTKQRSKDARIAGLTNYYSSGQIFMNEQQIELIEEYRVWGKSKNIHILDALAWGPEVWRPGWLPGSRAAMNAGYTDQEDNRDVQTGYSSID